MSQNMDIFSLKREFLEYLEVQKGRSLRTIENYDRYLNRFLKFSKINNPNEIDDALIHKFRLWLNRQKGTSGEMKRKTQNYYLIALRMFLKYLARKEIKSLSSERIELAKVGQRDLDLISEEELGKLLNAPDDEIKILPRSKRPSALLRGLRDKAIMELLFSTGLRVSELCSLNREHVTESRSGEFSIRGKGEKIRVVFLSDKAKTAIKNYLSKRTDIDEALFIRISNLKSQISNLRLTPRSVERIIKQYAIKAGISKKVTPHIIRHCFATDLLRAGADLRSVQSLLGHSNITTTQIYTHVTDKQLREVHKAFHSRRRK